MTVTVPHLALSVRGMGRLWAPLLLALLWCSGHAASGVDPTRVLFVGESFGGVPAQLAHVASSLRVGIQTEQSTLRDCTAYALRPDWNHPNSTTMRLFRDYEWDFIVVQTFTALPTVVKARAEYLRPALEAIARLKKRAKVVMYLPHAAHDGVQTRCPVTPARANGNGSVNCFPLGTLEELTNPPCSTAPVSGTGAWNAKVKGFDCMTYSLARGCLSTMSFGADMVAPCGLAWEAVRSSGPMPWGPPRDCVQQTDAEYGSEHPSPLNGAAELPLLASSTPDLTHLVLSNHTATKNHTVYTDTAVGEYLDALVLFATLFGTSPVGGAQPLSDWRNPNASLPSPLDAQNASDLQALAEFIVISHYEVWGSTPPSVLPVNPTRPNPLLLDIEIGVTAGLVLLLVCAILRPVLCPSRLQTAPRPSPTKGPARHHRGPGARRSGADGRLNSGDMVDPLLSRAEASAQAAGNGTVNSRAFPTLSEDEEGIDDLSRGRYQEV